MDVVKSNFQKTLPKIKEAIETASFVSIDGEFTGLETLKKLNPYDTHAERYLKIREGDHHFLIIQFGLCTFHYDPENDNYWYKAFNFYIFPQTTYPTQDSLFLSQPSSLEFLINQNFDFNKLIREGVPYLTSVNYNQLSENLERKHKEQLKRLNTKTPADESTISIRNMIPIPEENKEFMKEIGEQFEEFFLSKKKKLSFPPCNSFLRRLIYDFLDSKNMAGLKVSTDTNSAKEKFLVVKRATEDQVISEAKEQQQQELNQLEEIRGFYNVIELLSGANKLVVGHNMLLDVMYALQQFVHPLPDRYDEFKGLAKCTFNYVVDTKLVASTSSLKEHFQSTALSGVLTRLHSSPFSLPHVEPSEGFPGYNLADDKLHQAGYDAFITGLALIGLVQGLDKNAGSITHETKAIAPYINKIFLMQSTDLTFMDLDSAEVMPQRSHVYHIEFPKEWKTQDIMELFSPFGGAFISWIGDTTAFVALKNAPAASLAYNTLYANSAGIYYISTYSEFKQLERKNVNKFKPQGSALPSSKRQKFQPASAGQTDSTTSTTSNKKLSGKRKSMHENANDSNEKSSKKPKNSELLFEEPDFD